MRKKIFIYQMLLVMIGIAIMAFTVFQISHGIYQNELKKNLTSNAELIRYEMSSDKSSVAKSRNPASNTTYYNDLAHKYSNILNSQGDREIRISIITYDGEVVGDSVASLDKTKSHKYRKEVIEAVKSGFGSDIRVSDTLNKDYLYIAVSLPDQKLVIRVAESLKDIQNIDGDIMGLTAGALVFGLFITAIISALLSAFISKPIEYIREAMEKIYDGDYSTRIYSDSNEEVRKLSQGFNAMSEKLERTIESLEDKQEELELIMNNMFNGIIAVDFDTRILLINGKAEKILGIESDTELKGSQLLTLTRKTEFTSIIEEVMDTGEPLTTVVTMHDPDGDRHYRVHCASFDRTYIHEFEKDSRAILMSIIDVTVIKRLESVRSEFVSNVTHELKTPLTSIRGFVETLKKGAINKPEIAISFLDIIDMESERLYALINDILSLSEIETMKHDSNIEELNLKAQIDGVTAIIRSEADKRGVEIINAVPEDIFVKMNKSRNKQLFLNLIENAVKYNNENGKVFIDAHKRDGDTVVTVRDTGIGIPEEQIQRIFERFYRVDSGRSSELGGTGLGLSIVKHIASLYGVSVEVESRENVGTQFKLTFKGDK